MPVPVPVPVPVPARTLALLGRLLRNRIGPLVLHVRTA